MEVSNQKLVNEPKEGEEPKYETVREEQTLNSMIPIWQKAKKDVTEEEYNNFYHEKFFDYEKPLSVLHFGVEGAVTYKALLYIPATAPYDFYTRDYKAGLQLYSSGVLIMENCADLLPEHFRFVRGVVDTQPEHQPRDAAAHERAEGHRRQPRKEDQGRAGAHAEGRP